MISFHTQLPLDHCPHLRAHPDQEWWRSSDAKVCRYLILQDLIWVHLPSQVPGHPDGFVDAGLLGLPGVWVNVRGESPPCPLPHPQVCLAAALFFYPLLSLATIAGYWLWFLYLKYLKMESEASKEVKRKCTIVNLLEIILLFEKSLNRVALLIMVSLAQRAHSV